MTIATQNDFLSEVSRFVRDHSDGLQHTWLEDRGLIAWHVLNKRMAWRWDKDGLTAVMFFWQIEDPHQVEDSVIQEIEGRGECVYIPFMAIAPRAAFQDLIGGMLEYAVDNCTADVKWITFERSDGRIRRYRIRENHGIG